MPPTFSFSPVLFNLPCLWQDYFSFPLWCPEDQPFPDLAGSSPKDVIQIMQFTCQQSELFWELLFITQCSCFSNLKVIKNVWVAQKFCSFLTHPNRNVENNVVLTLFLFCQSKGKERKATRQKPHLNLRLEFDIERYWLSVHITLRGDWLLWTSWDYLNSSSPTLLPVI